MNKQYIHEKYFKREKCVIFYIIARNRSKEQNNGQTHSKICMSNLFGWRPMEPVLPLQACLTTYIITNRVVCDNRVRFPRQPHFN